MRAIPGNSSEVNGARELSRAGRCHPAAPKTPIAIWADSDRPTDEPGRGLGCAWLTSSEQSLVWAAVGGWSGVASVPAALPDSALASAEPRARWVVAATVLGSGLAFVGATVVRGCGRSR
jgi:hypothetical protein